MKEILLWLWQLPQHLIALLLRYMFAWEYSDRHGDIRIYYSEKFPGSVCFGQYVFMRRRYEWTTAHECGHSMQSLWLGPLYLLVIGLPSICWAGWCLLDNKGEDIAKYYSFYTERWANRIAGIKTEDRL